MGHENVATVVVRKQDYPKIRRAVEKLNRGMGDDLHIEETGHKVEINGWLGYNCLLSHEVESLLAEHAVPYNCHVAAEDCTEKNLRGYWRPGMDEPAYFDEEFTDFVPVGMLERLLEESGSDPAHCVSGVRELMKQRDVIPELPNNNNG